MFNAPYARLVKEKSNRKALLKELLKLDREEITAGIHKGAGAQK